MENEHSELIIGYLQGRLHGRDLDNFYVWVNESADNKKLFFETKALYEACTPSREKSEIQDSWLRLLEKFSDLNLCPINNRQGIVIDGEGSKVICKD